VLIAILLHLARQTHLIGRKFKFVDIVTEYWCQFCYNAIVSFCETSRHRKAIIIIIIIIIIITFMRGIYNYMPETTRIYRVYSVAAVLYLQFVLHVTSFRP
jgi:hypothetical protein